MSTLPENIGFIRDNLDIKILILFVLEKLPAPVDAIVLSELVLFDKGFTWFEYSDCLADLVSSGLAVQTEDDRYEITDNGRNTISYVASSLPYSVRAKADRLAAPVAAILRRSRMIETYSEQAQDGNFTVSLRLSDGMGELISLRLAVPDSETAEKIENRFRSDAENITNQILQILT